MKGVAKTGAFVNQLRKELTALAEEEKSTLFTLSTASDGEEKKKYENQMKFVNVFKTHLEELINAMAEDWHIK